MPDVKDCLLTTAAAARAGVPRKTLASAIDRNELRHYLLADGKTRVVKTADVDAWAAKERPLGRKPKRRKP